MRVFLTGLAAMAIALLSTSANAAEAYVPHRHHWRVFGPQSCFLTPDAVVQLGARGPYCSSPRGSYPALAPVRYRFYYAPHDGWWFGQPLGRPWGWFGPWGWGWGW
jgi:hypothetical protein